jgi:hypothetical protein
MSMVIGRCMRGRSIGSAIAGRRRISGSVGCGGGGRGGGSGADRADVLFGAVLRFRRWVRRRPRLPSGAGLSLDAWQRFVLDGALGVRADGNWSAFEVGLVVSRQNGKGGILEARELLGLFELGERLIVHSAHQFDTSMEAFLRMEQLLEEGGLIGELRPRGGISRSHGSEGFVLKDGRRLRYRTRTKGGGRGFSADCVVLDEAMILPEASHSALLPTLSARPNPQVWYTGSAVDQMVHEDGVVFARIRDRGHRGSDSLAYFEWSASDLPLAEVGPELLDDRDLWRRANPAMGIRITEEYVVKERESLDERGFAVERLGVGDWPPIDRYAGNIIRPEDWAALEDRGSSIAGGLVFRVRSVAETVVGFDSGVGPAAGREAPRRGGRASGGNGLGCPAVEGAGGASRAACGRLRRSGALSDGGAPGGGCAGG